MLQARRLHPDELAAARVVEDGDRHPLTDHDQVRPTVAIHVTPDRVGHHAHVFELGREPFGHVGEVTVPVVLEQHTPGIDAVVPRDDPPAHEEIDVSVAVVVGRGHARAAHVFVRQAPDRLAEGAPPVVQVQSILERGRHGRELAAAAHDVQIGVPVAVGVEEHGANVFRSRVGIE